MLYMVILFVSLTPGVLVTLPPQGSKYMVSATHGFIFVIVWCFTYNTVSRIAEGFESGNAVAGTLCTSNDECETERCVESRCQ